MPQCFYCELTVEETSKAIVRDGTNEFEIDVCADCISDYCFTCNGCEQLYDTDSRNTIRIGENQRNRLSYCVGCRNKNTFRCATCNSLHHISSRRKLVMYYVNDHTEIIDANGERNVCKPCYASNYRRCQTCNSDTLSGQLQVDGQDRRVCRRCVNFNVLIKNYSSQPMDYMPFRGEKRVDGKQTMYMGIELEVTLKDHKNVARDHVARRILPLVADFSIFTLDSSVPNGWEIKTTPATFEYHMKAWEPFFNYIDENKQLLQERGEGCGMHVHLSRNAMTPLQIGRFICFINEPNNREFMHKIAERDTPKFAPYHDGMKAVHNWKCLNNVKTHHQAVNLLKAQTVEIRIFASMLKRENFYKNLEFLQALLDFTAPLSCSDFKDYRRFEDYVAQRERDFPHLYNFLNPLKPYKPVRKKLRDIAKSAPRFLDNIEDDELEAVAQWIGISPHKVLHSDKVAY
jgi:hypothetical protein